MVGAYCRFCDRRCFVARVLPDRSWSGHMATCAAGMTHDRAVTGHDHTTAINPLAPAPEHAAPRPTGLELQEVTPDAWRVVHTASGKCIPFLDWDRPELPRRLAEIAVASLVDSGVDWTRTQAQLVDELPSVADAARAASTAAYDAAVQAGEITDERVGAHRLETRHGGT